RADALPGVPDSELDEWLRTENIVELAEACQRRLDAFYRVAARAAGKPFATFFTEKYGPGFVPVILRELYPRAREIFLVRDPRDQLGSMLSWNERTRQGDFGGGAGTPEEAARWLS